MQFQQPQASLGEGRHCSSADRVMWITPDRVFYVGLLGAPSKRALGAITVYVSLEAPIRLCLAEGEWQTADIAIVQPYVPHRVACDARHIAVLKIEPETVDLARLPALLKSPSGPVIAPEFAEHVRRCHRSLLAGSLGGRSASAAMAGEKSHFAPIFPAQATATVLKSGHKLDSFPTPFAATSSAAQAPSGQSAVAAFPDFDELLFGGRLPQRSMDARIAAVLENIRRYPAGQAIAQDCAEQVHLSFSRFLHLFKREVGAPFRSFRTWKRARSLLHYVMKQNSTLTDVALDAGYPDSTHFSHSIRQVYGLKPRDIFAGSRKLRVIVPAAAATPAGFNPLR